MKPRIPGLHLRPPGVCEHWPPPWMSAAHVADWERLVRDEGFEIHHHPHEDDEWTLSRTTYDAGFAALLDDLDP